MKFIKLVYKTKHDPNPCELVVGSSDLMQLSIAFKAVSSAVAPDLDVFIAVDSLDFGDQ